MNCTNYFDKKVNIQEAICTMETKINELIEMYNRVDSDHTVIAEKVKELESLVDYLTGTGLEAEVKKQLEKWLADGTFDPIIVNVLSEWTDKISKIEDRAIIYVSDFPKQSGEVDDYLRLKRAYDKAKQILVIDQDLNLGNKVFYLTKSITIQGSGKTITGIQLEINYSNCYIYDLNIVSNMPNGIVCNKATVDGTNLNNVKVTNASEHCFLFESYAGVVSNTRIINCHSNGGIHGFISKATNTYIEGCTAKNHSSAGSIAFGIISDDIGTNMANAIGNTIENCRIDNCFGGLYMYSRKKRQASPDPINENHIINGLNASTVTTAISIGDGTTPSGYLSIGSINKVNLSNLSIYSGGKFDIELKNITNGRFSNIQGCTQPFISTSTTDVDYNTKSSFINSIERRNYESIVNLGSAEKCDVTNNRLFDCRHNATTTNKIGIKGTYINGTEITILVRGMGGSMSYGGWEDDFVTRGLTIPTSLAWNEVLVTKWLFSDITKKWINVQNYKTTYSN